MRSLFIIAVTLLVLLEFSEGHRNHQRSNYNCNDPPETGMCRASFRKWYHDNGTCREFTYGGCGGNNNKFPTRSTCERHCRVRTQQTRCSTRPCTKDCPFGFMFDEATNCTLCACKPNPSAVDCPQIECPDSCPNGYEQDESGCTTCFCRPSVQHRVAPRSVTCPPYICYIGCQYGNKKDENGCALCQCNTKEEVCGTAMCRMACPGGFKEDQRGCDICECKSSSKESGRYQGNGRHQSSGKNHGGSKHHGSGKHNGRKTTQASPAQLPSDGDSPVSRRSGSKTSCPTISCRLDCKHRVKDSFGCELCACASRREPERRTQPPRGRPWSGRVSPTPSPASPCDNRPMCMMHCEVYTKDAEGCNKCECA